MNEHLYTLEELFNALIHIKENGDGPLNYPKALLSILVEIKRLQQEIWKEESKLTS
tara:strand:+ start:6942 stop:7109 length:168 start_codon:yes stop_codon:yes gene_type:complete